MNKKVLIIEIVVLVVLTAINFYLFFNRNQQTQCYTEKCTNTECYLSHEISLTQEQKLQYEKIKEKYQQQAILIADSLHISQEYLMRNLMNDTQDTLKIKEIESDHEQG